MNVLVSIIIPIYNVEEYIKKTVESVMNQDYKNIEIILVDDGSPDNSSVIIDNLANVDNRIKCIHKKNGGVSSARNAGIRVAKGEYITFIDGDDWVEPNYVSYLLSLVQASNCKIGMNKNNFSDFNQKTSEKTYCVPSRKATEWIYLGDVFVAVWNKIYQTSFLRENNIYFNEDIWYGEGMLFNIICLSNVEKVAIGEKSVYHQVTNPNSAMRKFNVESNLCGIKSLDIQKEYLDDNDVEIIDAWKYHRRAFNLTIVSGLSRCGMELEYSDLYRECINNLKKNLWVSLKVNIPLKLKLMYIAWAVIPNYMVKRCKR